MLTEPTLLRSVYFSIYKGFITAYYRALLDKVPIHKVHNINTIYELNLSQNLLEVINT